MTIYLTVTEFGQTDLTPGLTLTLTLTLTFNRNLLTLTLIQSPKNAPNSPNPNPNPTLQPRSGPLPRPSPQCQFPGAPLQGTALACILSMASKGPTGSTLTPTQIRNFRNPDPDPDLTPTLTHQAQR